MVGTIKNVDNAISSGWKNINDQIWIIGSNASESSIAASSYLEYFHDLVTEDLLKLIYKMKNTVKVF